VAKNARACPGCKRLQEPPLNPDVLLENGEFSGEELAEAMWADQLEAFKVHAERVHRRRRR